MGSKTLGQVAFTAFYKSLGKDIPEYSSQDDTLQTAWEAVSAAVLSPPVDPLEAACIAYAKALNATVPETDKDTMKATLEKAQAAFEEAGGKDSL